MNASPRYTRSGDISWFTNDAFGMFIHVGLGSSAGIELNMKSFSAADYKAGSADSWSPERYYALKDFFGAEDYDPREWARVAKEAGCRYVILGAKHHDGFCLWPTKTKELHAGNFGPKRDMVGPFVEAVREAGLKVGLYMSLIDWEDPDFTALPASVRFSSPVREHDFSPVGWDRFLGRVFTQVEELLTWYGKIDVLWFDVPGWGADIWHADELKMMMLSIQPHIICCDRLPGCGEYATPEQQIPVSPLEVPWETCMTCNESWTYHPDAEKYKPTRSLIRKLCEIRSLGGNLLLNVGPDSRGRFPEPAVKRFLEIGEWLRRSGDSIYGAARGVDYLHYWGPSTRNGNTLYCHLLTRPDPELELRGIASDPERVFVLQTGQVLPFQRVSNRIVIDFAACEFDPLCTTVALAFSEAPASLQFASTVFTTRGPALW